MIKYFGILFCFLFLGCQETQYSFTEYELISFSDIIVTEEQSEQSSLYLDIYSYWQYNVEYYRFYAKSKNDGSIRWFDVQPKYITIFHINNENQVPLASRISSKRGIDYTFMYNGEWHWYIPDGMIIRQLHPDEIIIRELK